MGHRQSPYKKPYNTENTNPMKNYEVGDIYHGNVLIFPPSQPPILSQDGPSSKQPTRHHFPGTYRVRASPLLSLGSTCTLVVFVHGND